MTQPDQRTLFLHLLTAQLQDNIGQRLTHSLCNGILATLDANLPRAEAPAEPLPAIQPPA